MDIVVNASVYFMSMFQAGGKTLVSLITGILPTLACLLVVVKAIVKFIGEEKLEALAQKGANSIIIRYVVLPSLSWLILANPMAFTMGRFLPQKYKGAFFDAICALGHPFTGLFPHTDPSELFIWLGVSQGLVTLGLPVAGLAVGYLVAGITVALIRGLVTERLWIYFAKKKGIDVNAGTGATTLN
ncbi:PTS glucitol/sorbitol transporter subunit IIC [Propionispora vibrioides]|uniref:PTS system, glucitol/sorbitol-specific IIC component n=1 Tax=Propionispora vibrioides TaxID=112903 RepID=A0A1H8T6R0_9FIRM|nr:glucitol/sorbitol-specific PTS transporter subunit IIC [Propionispora vibrioides]SEO86153.1 PTS system, glucitol/sorbitol-specific IIC component [Propionispora vibrioides]